MYKYSLANIVLYLANMSKKTPSTLIHMMDTKIYNFRLYALNTMDPNSENNKKMSMFDCGDKIIAKLIQEIESIRSCKIPNDIKLEYLLKLTDSYVSFFANMSGMVSGIFRGPYCEKISWSIISNVDELLQIKDFLGPNIVDLMCGQGYISYLLSLLDCKVQSIDNFSSHGVSDDSFKFCEIEKVNIQSLEPKYYSFIASWPSYKCRELTKFLNKLKKLNIGFKIVYIGEGEGGCTGSDCLFELFDSLNRVKEIYNKTWNNIHDYMVFYERECVNEDSIVKLLSLSASKYLSAKKIGKKLSIKKSYALNILHNSPKFVSCGLKVVGSIRKGTVWTLRT